MDATRLLPRIGILICVLLLGSITAPYVLLPEIVHAEINTYYAHGWFGPITIGVFTTVTIVVFGSAVADRSDPATTAGVMMVIGVFILGMALQWAIVVPSELVRGISTEGWFIYHRWVIVGLAAIVAACGIGYARGLGLIST